MHAKELDGEHIGRRVTIRRQIGEAVQLITAPLRQVQHRATVTFVTFDGVRPTQGPIARAFGNTSSQAFVLDPDEHVLLEHPGWTEQQIWETRPDSEREQAVEGAEQ